MGNEIVNYYEMDPFRGIYLEDSYVLELTIGLDRTQIVLELVLDKAHSKYSVPVLGEQYCYRKGKIVFSNYSDAILTNIISTPNVDVTGEKDFGNIDYLRMVGADFELGGEWGNLNIRNGEINVEVI